MNKRTELVKNALSAKAFWQINKHLGRTIGILPALLLSHLIDLVTNYEDMPEEFYQQYSRLQKSLGLSKHQLMECIKVLRDQELIGVELKGIPAKNHYTLNIDNILNAMVGPEASSEKSAPLAVESLDRKDRKKEKEKKNSSAKADGDYFNDKSQVVEHELASRVNWDKLTSLWVTTENIGILKRTFKNHFLPLSAQRQEEILNDLQFFGPDVKKLKNLWISTAFAEDLVYRHVLATEINKQLVPQNINKPKGGVLTQDNF